MWIPLNGVVQHKNLDWLHIVGRVHITHKCTRSVSAGAKHILAFTSSNSGDWE